MAGILSMIPGVALMAFAFSGKLAGKGEIDFMAASSSLLFFILSFFLMCVGFLCELVNQEGEFRSLESLKARVE
jgi:hypothetical protein